MSRPIRLLLVTVLLVAVPLAGMARRARRKPQPKLPGPEVIAWRFCQLDLQGARLSAVASGSEEIASLQVTPGAAKPAKFVIAADCDIGAVSPGTATARVTVTFSDLGTITREGEIVAAHKQETVTLTLKKLGNDWKISGAAALLPHVSTAALAASWQHTANLSKDAYERDHAANVAAELLELDRPAEQGRRVDTSLKQPVPAAPGASDSAPAIPSSDPPR